MKEKWFPEVHHHCPGVPCLIVGTQVDLRDDPAVTEKLARQKQRPVSSEAGERLARELGAVKYVECSALTQRGLKNVFDEVGFFCFLGRTDLSQALTFSSFLRQSLPPWSLPWYGKSPSALSSRKSNELGCEKAKSRG